MALYEIRVEAPCTYEYPIKAPYNTELSAWGFKEIGQAQQYLFYITNMDLVLTPF